MADGQRGQGEIAHRRGAQRGHVRRGELHSFALLLLLLLLVSGAECGLCRRSALAKRLGGVVRTVEESARRRFGVVERTLRSVQLIAAAAAANQRWPTDRIHLLARVAALQNGDGLSLLLMLLLMTSCARRGRLFAVMSRLGRRKRWRWWRRRLVSRAHNAVRVEVNDVGGLEVVEAMIVAALVELLLLDLQEALVVGQREHVVLLGRRGRGRGRRLGQLAGRAEGRERGRQDGRQRSTSPRLARTTTTRTRTDSSYCEWRR